MSRRMLVIGGAALMLTACASDVARGPAVTFVTVAPAQTGVAVTSTAATTTEPTTTSSDTAATSATAGPSTTEVPTSTSTSTATANTTNTTTVVLGDPVVTFTQVAALTSSLDISVRPGDDAVYVTEQGGKIVPVRNGTPGDAVVDITSLTNGDGEQGLLGMAFHPTQPFAYIDFTDKSGNTVVDEYGVAADGTFDPASRRQVLTIDQPYANHNGGSLVFGPDGYLYIGMGDGGSANDPERRALNVSVPLGKILRIDPRPSADQPYGIPADNPFVGVPGARPEIFTVGMRNPWRMTFDRGTGDLWIGDVGQGAWEEVDVGWADQGGGRGMNFGWSAFEGTHPLNPDQSADGATPPIFEYAHGDAGCSISGGQVYRGTAIAALVGWYVYGDYCAGKVRALHIVNRAVVGEVVLGDVANVGAVAEGPDGELYAASLTGPLYRLDNAG